MLLLALRAGEFKPSKIFHPESDDFFPFKITLEKPLCKRIFNLPLHCTAQRPGAIFRVETLRDKMLLDLIIEANLEPLFVEAITHISQLELDNFSKV